MRFFLDFDGTISSQDVVDVVLERFADERWKDVEKDWVEGRIGSRECLGRQVDLVRASTEEVYSAISSVKVDSHFVPFILKAKELEIPVAIVSDGFDLLIRQVLTQNLPGLSGVWEDLPLFSNKLLKTKNGFKALFPAEIPCPHGCANCKEAVMEKWAQADQELIFVGDGFSDRYAAKRAGLTFAKGKLLTYCRDNGIEHLPYENFKTITQWMSKKWTPLKKVS